MAEKREANLKILSEADEIQTKSKEAIFRIQKQVTSFPLYISLLIM